MADPGPSKSRILAALDLTEDDSSPSTGPSIPMHLFSQQAGQKRKRAADYSGIVTAPLNKRQPSRIPRTELNRLPAGLLASTQSSGEHLSLYFSRPAVNNTQPLDAVITEPALSPEERSIRETQSVITAVLRSASSDQPLDREFQVTFDSGSPLTRLDIGGDDQEQRHVHCY
jgi:hypothetical protein